ncbi:MAG: glycerol-3-phosphate 1-O-acyltransferase PlsY, partial [Clostridiales Family XIII bacterium]|nr:glycerol-3-phosphate 1-O-acyltransferase PlsY [Clostridiales Family XIII bacterium]
LSYFVGNISPSSIIGKFYGIDIRNIGSGNAGATNALRTMGKKAGLITLILDILKGFIMPLITFLFIGLPGYYFAGFFVVIGHMWPVVFKFKGGKGVATAVGTLFFINPLVGFIGLIIVLVFTLITKIVSFAVLLACIIIIPLSFFIAKNDFPYIFLIVVLIIIKHSGNINRLFNGTENKISLGTPKKDKEAYLRARESAKKN